MVGRIVWSTSPAVALVNSASVGWLVGWLDWLRHGQPVGYLVWSKMFGWLVGSLVGYDMVNPWVGWLVAKYGWLVFWLPLVGYG